VPPSLFHTIHSAPGFARNQPPFFVGFPTVRFAGLSLFLPIGWWGLCGVAKARRSASLARRVVSSSLSSSFGSLLIGALYYV